MIMYIYIYINCLIMYTTCCTQMSAKAVFFLEADPHVFVFCTRTWQQILLTDIANYSLGIQSHCDMMIRGSNHTLIMIVTSLRR